MIYADNAATTRLDSKALEVMYSYLSESYGNASQLYSFSRASRKALHGARVIIADCIGASPEEIYFTSGGTESDNWAIRGAKKSGKGIITSAIEHHAVLYSCALYGNEVFYLNPDKYGVIDSEILKQKISSETGLVSIMLANNEIGTIEPVADLAKLAHDKGAIFHTDAVQAAGHIPIDVEALGVDLLSASAHKFNGPKGVGFLYVRKGTEIESFMRGGSQESGMRAGTENVASIAAMAVALRNNCADMEVISNRLCHLEEILLEELNKAGIDFVRNGAEMHLPGNISLSFKSVSGEMLLHRLDLKGICVSTGAACDSVNTKVSHVIEAIGVPRGYAEGTIRISLGRYNTEDDALEIASALAGILKPRR